MRFILALLLMFTQGTVSTGPTISKGPTVVSGSITANQAHLARQFNGTSDFLSTGGASIVLTGSVLSIGFRLYQNSFGSTDALALETSSNFNLSQSAWSVNPNASVTANFYFSVFTGSATYLTCFFTRPSAAAWHTYLLVLNVTAINGACAAFVDGVSVSVTKNTGSTATTFNASSNYPLFVMSRAGTSLFNAGRMTAIALWTADESANASTLASCSTDPSTIDNANLQYYWKIQQTSPETPTVGSVNLNVTGTTNVAGPC
jgi:hypothetical protein